MKTRILFICLIYAGFVSCGQQNNHSQPETPHVHANCSHDYSHEGHSHDGHDHGHDHSADQKQHSHDHDDHTNCDHSHADHDHNHGHSHSPAGSPSHDHDDLIEICPETAKAAGITTAQVTRKPFAQVIPAIGEILPMQGDIVTVTAKNEGFVLLDSKRVFSGTAVRSGEKVMVITTQGITQDNYTETLLQAEIAYNNTRQAYERNRELYRDKLVTLTELQNSEAEFKAAELRYNNLRTGFEKDGLRVTAPTSGYVTEMLVNEGDFVSLGKPLFTVSRNRDVVLRAEVSPQYMSLLPKVVSANFRTSASGAFYSVTDLGGKITSYGRSVESSSLLVPVYFSIPYSPEYPAGSYAEIKLLTADGNNYIVIPKEAIIEDFGHYFVYVADEHGYERRDIRIGGSNGIDTQVISGLTEGEEIVVTGANRVKLVERLGALGAEAAHAGHSH